MKSNWRTILLVVAGIHSIVFTGMVMRQKKQAEIEKEKIKLLYDSTVVVNTKFAEKLNTANFENDSLKKQYKNVANENATLIREINRLKKELKTNVQVRVDIIDDAKSAELASTKSKLSILRRQPKPERN